MEKKLEKVYISYKHDANYKGAIDAIKRGWIVPPSVSPAAIKAPIAPIWTVMSAPIPRCSYAVWTIEVSVIVLQIPSPVIRIFSDCHDCPSHFLVKLYLGIHVFRYHYRVFLISKKIYLRGFGFLYQRLCLGLCFFPFRFCA